MLKTGILNPQLNSLLARVRHTNTLVIADRGFPFWPGVETIDLSLVDGVPTVLQVLTAIRGNFVVGQAFMASQFLAHNTEETKAAFARAQQLARQMFAYGRPLALEEMTARIDAIRVEDVRRVGAAMLGSAPTVAAIGRVGKVIDAERVARRLGRA